VIHSQIRLKSKQTHIIISVLNLAMLNYTTIKEIFVLTVIEATWACRNIEY